MFEVKYRFYLHSIPVPLNTLLLKREFKTGNFNHIKEGLTDHP